MSNLTEPIYYFGFGTNKDLAMMEHIVGRQNITGEPGKLLGYEVCIQRADQFRTEIPANSPLHKSPRDIIAGGWGPEFEMYVSRPNAHEVAWGTIWQLTPDELEHVREWEMVEYGAQEDAWGTAVNDNGEEFHVITQSFMKPPIEIDRVVHERDYEPYIWSKADMLRVADENRVDYLQRKAEGIQ